MTVSMQRDRPATSALAKALAEAGHTLRVPAQIDGRGAEVAEIALDIAADRLRAAGWTVYEPGAEPPRQRTRPRARASDPATSRDAAAASVRKAGTIAHRLLRVYRAARHDLGMGRGLTDAEVSARANLPTAWRRCSDLRSDGLIESIGPLHEPGPVVTRLAPSGMRQQVCRITAAGLAELDRLDALESARSKA